MQNLRGVQVPFWTPCIYTDTRLVKAQKIVISDFRQLLLLIIIWILKNFPLEVSKDKPKSISTKKVRTIVAVVDKKRNRYNTTADSNDTTADPNDATVQPVTINYANLYIWRKQDKWNLWLSPCTKNHA